MDIQASDGHSSERPLLFRSNPRRFIKPAGRNRSPWTAHDVDRLRELMERQRPICEIAGLLGRTQEAVRTKAYQLERLSSQSV